MGRGPATDAGWVGTTGASRHDTPARAGGRERRRSARRRQFDGKPPTDGSALVVAAGMTIVETTVSGVASPAVQRDSSTSKSAVSGRAKRAMCRGAPARNRALLIVQASRSAGGRSGHRRPASAVIARRNRVAPWQREPAESADCRNRGDQFRAALSARLRVRSCTSTVPDHPGQHRASGGATATRRRRPATLDPHSSQRRKPATHAAETGDLCEHLVAVSRERRRSENRLGGAHDGPRQGQQSDRLAKNRGSGAPVDHQADPTTQIPIAVARVGSGRPVHREDPRCR